MRDVIKGWRGTAGADGTVTYTVAPGADPRGLAPCADGCGAVLARPGTCDACTAAALDRVIPTALRGLYGVEQTASEPGRCHGSVTSGGWHGRQRCAYRGRETVAGWAFCKMHAGKVRETLARGRIYLGHDGRHHAQGLPGLWGFGVMERAGSTDDAPGLGTGEGDAVRAGRDLWARRETDGSVTTWRKIPDPD